VHIVRTSFVIHPSTVATSHAFLKEYFECFQPAALTTVCSPTVGCSTWMQYKNSISDDLAVTKTIVPACMQRTASKYKSVD
jgi:hypothetical protein